MTCRVWQESVEKGKKYCAVEAKFSLLKTDRSYEKTFSANNGKREMQTHTRTLIKYNSISFGAQVGNDFR